MPATILRGLLFVLLSAAPAAAQITPLWQTPYGGRFSLWSPSGDRVAMVGGGGIIVLDLPTNDTVLVPRVAPQQVEFNNDGSLLYCLQQNDRRIIVYDATTSGLSDTIMFHDTSITAFGLCPDRSTGYARYRDSTIVIWEVASRTEIMRLEDSPYGRVVFDRSGDRFALLPLSYGSFSSQPVEVYSVSSRSRIASLGDNEVHACFPLDEDRLISTSQNGAITLWEISTGRRVTWKYWSLEVAGNINRLEYFDDEQLLLFTEQWAEGSGYTHYAYVYRATDFEQLHSDTLEAAAISDDGTIMAELTRQNTVRLYSAADLSHLVDLDVPAYPQSVGLGGDGSYASIECYDGTTRIISVDGPEEVAAVDLQGVNAAQAFVASDNILLRTGSRAVVLDLRTGTAINDLYPASPQPEFLLSDRHWFERSEDTITVRDYVSGDVVSQYQRDEGLFNELQVSSDGGLAVSPAGDSIVRVWDAYTGETLVTITSTESLYKPIAFDPTGSLCAIMDRADTTIRVFSTVDGEEHAPLEGLGRPFMFDLDIVNIDDRPAYVAAVEAGPAGPLKIWDLETQQLAHELVAGDQPFNTFMQIGSSSRAVLRGNDSSIRVIDVVTGEVDILYEFPDRYPFSLAIVGNDEALLTVDYRGMAILLSLQRTDTLVMFQASSGVIVPDRSRSVVAMGGIAGPVMAIDLSGFLTTSVEATADPLGNAESAPSISVAPHPLVSGSTVTVTFPDSREQQVQLVDISGRVLWQGSGNGSPHEQSFVIPDAQMNTGAHVVVARCRSGMSVVPVVREGK